MTKENESNPLKKTPLHPFHLQQKAKMVPFAGYEMPVQYKGVLEEARAVRSHAGLFDVSHMGQFSIRGQGALEALQTLVTNDLSRLKIGQAQYNALCFENGGTIDDLVVYHRAEDWTYICVNAANREKDFEWLRSHLPQTLSLEDESESTALIALQGPKVKQLVESWGKTELTQSLKYYWAQEAEIFGIPLYASRTGYTGEYGFEFYVSEDRAAELWDRILESGQTEGLVPVGLGARDTLRTEMGFALYGHELSPELSPLAAGLNWVVKLKKPNFIGKDALVKEAQSGAALQLKALKITDRRMARPGYRILDTENQVIGTVSSGVFSPHLETPIALGFLKKDFTHLNKCRIEIRQAHVEAEVVGLPFVQNQTK